MILADTTAAEGFLGSIGILLALWYAILAFLVPVFIYRTMRRATQILEEIKRYRPAPVAATKLPPVDRPGIQAADRL
jgi:hypothetical protein